MNSIQVEYLILLRIFSNFLILETWDRFSIFIIFEIIHNTRFYIGLLKSFVFLDSAQNIVTSTFFQSTVMFSIWINAWVYWPSIASYIYFGALFEFYTCQQLNLCQNRSFNLLRSQFPSCSINLITLYLIMYHL